MKFYVDIQRITELAYRHVESRGSTDCSDRYDLVFAYFSLTEKNRLKEDDKRFIAKWPLPR